MEKASQDLYHEHDNILVTLNILEKICSSLKSVSKTDLHDVGQIIYFIRIYSDKCHHGKEEGFLFPALEEAGIKKENIQVSEIILEHQLSRELVIQMQKSISCNTIEIGKFIKASFSFIDLLRDHIKKENLILFPLADSLLPENKQKELLENFKIFEEKVIGKGKHHELHSILKTFERKYLAEIPA